MEWLPSSVLFRRSTKRKFRQKRKAWVDPDATDANLSWTDDEVEVLLGVVHAYSSQKDYEGLVWESVKSKHEDIRKDFVTLYEQQDGLPHDVSLFTRERLTSKLKNIRKKKEMVSEMKQMDKEYQQTMTRFASTWRIWVNQY